MAHREKHRHTALLRRVEAKRTIKSDLDDKGKPNSAYKDAKKVVTQRRKDAVAAKKSAKQSDG